MKCLLRKQLFDRLAPYKDILIFMLTLLVANYAWKWTFTGDEYGEVVTWLGLDVTAPFKFMALHIARMVYELVSLFRDEVSLVDEMIIRYDNGVGTAIVWGCTGLKQGFIWLCLMLTVPATQPAYKTWLRKLWFIPLGWLCCYIFNILRITAIALLIEHHPDWFSLLHDHLFKYAFYAMFFGLWVLFVEKLRPSSSAN